MTATILAALLPILGALIPFILNEITKKQAAASDPKNINQQRYEQIDQDIAKRDSDAATLHSSSDLDELDRLLRSKGQSH